MARGTVDPEDSWRTGYSDAAPARTCMPRLLRQHQVTQRRPERVAASVPTTGGTRTARNQPDRAEGILDVINAGTREVSRWFCLTGDRTDRFATSYPGKGFDRLPAQKLFDRPKGLN